jgi:hypothetical protein
MRRGGGGVSFVFFGIVIVLNIHEQECNATNLETIYSMCVVSRRRV